MKLRLMFVGYAAAMVFAIGVQAQETSLGLTFQTMRVLCTDGSMKLGVCIGLKGDSLLLHIAANTEKIAREYILTVSTIRKREPSTTLSGTLVGLYAGNLLFKAEDQPFSYTQSYDNWFFPAHILFALVGGGVGYLVGTAMSGPEVFNFAESDQERELEWERLRDLVSGERPGPTMRISLQCSWVRSSPPTQASDYDHYAPSNVTNLNMMRKIQATLTLSPLVDCGIGVMWLGQPSVAWSGPSTYYHYTIVELNGTGYYAIGVIKPLCVTNLRKLQWDIGIGAGFASMNYKVRHPWFSNAEDRETMFSGLVYTEVRVMLSGYLSLGVVGDWVYIPRDAPAIPKIELGPRTMRTTSVGLVLGFHF